MLDQTEFYAGVGRRIREARSRRQPRMTQRELAEAVSLTRSSLTNIERGRQKLLLHTLVAIAREIGVDLATLIPDAPPENSTDLDDALRDRSASERNWIRSAVLATRKEAGDGSP